MLRRLLALPFCLFAVAAIAGDPCSQPSPEKMAAEVGVELPSRPWHLANIWWQFEDAIEGFESLEIDIAIDRNVPEDYNLYIAPCGLAKVNGLQFYGGIQTNINGWPSKDDRVRVHAGRGVIFSRWSADLKTPLDLDHVRVADPTCLVESAGYEGSFASVRRPFQWKKGAYTWGITKGKTIEHNEGQATWLTCWIQDHTNDERLEVGSLLFEGARFKYWDRHSAFVEVYSTRKIPRSNIPKVNVTFGRPRINGNKVPLKNARAFYPGASSGMTASPDCAHVVTEGDRCIVQVGPIFKRDEARRRHPLDLE